MFGCFGSCFAASCTRHFYTEPDHRQCSANHFSFIFRIPVNAIEIKDLEERSELTDEQRQRKLQPF